MPEKDRFSEFLSFLSEVWKFLHPSKAEPEKFKLRAGESRQPDLERENAEMGRRETWGETTTHNPLIKHPGRCIWHARGSSP